MHSPSAYQQDIVDYVVRVCEDESHTLPKFIPIALPRRFGKTVIVDNLIGKVPIRKEDILFLDDTKDLDDKEFMRKVMVWHRQKNRVIVVLFTPVSETSPLPARLLGKFPAFHGTVCGGQLALTFPSGNVVHYDIDETRFLSTSKEREIDEVSSILGVNVDGAKIFD